MSIDAAVPCGLIINELVSNSLKHGFPEGRSGRINVGMRRAKSHEVELVVSDNGVGLDQDLNAQPTRSLGLRLVRILADQLGATCEVNSNEGTETRLVFNNAARSGNGEAR
jgi:two-component sensor histidine kinase